MNISLITNGKNYCGINEIEILHYFIPKIDNPVATSNVVLSRLPKNKIKFPKVYTLFMPMRKTIKAGLLFLSFFY